MSLSSGYTHAHTCADTHTHMHFYITHTYLHININKYTHTHTHRHAHTLLLVSKASVCSLSLSKNLNHAASRPTALCFVFRALRQNIGGCPMTGIKIFHSLYSLTIASKLSGDSRTPDYLEVSLYDIDHIFPSGLEEGEVCFHGDRRQVLS